MGISTKKNKTTTNQNTTATLTPTNPTFSTDAVGGLAGRTEDTFKTLDPYSLVPNADPLQTQAGQGAAGLTTSPNFGKASDILTGVAAAGPQHVQAGDIQGGIAGFLNPNLDTLVNSNLANYDEGAGFTRAQNKLSLAGDTTFGGSGGAIQTALSERGLADDRGRLAAELRSSAFDRAAGLAGQQAQLTQGAGIANAGLAEQSLSRQGAAAGGLADIGTAANTDTRANIGAQANIGDILRQIATAKAGAPITALGANADILSRIPLDLFKGSNAEGSLSGTSTSKTSGAGLGDWLNFFAANAQAASKGAGGGG